MESYSTILREQFKTNATIPVSNRKKSLQKLRNSVKKHESNIEYALRTDFNKSRFETYFTEIGLIYAEIDKALKNINDWAAPSASSGQLAFFPSKNIIIPVPYGVSLIIAPWNYPFMLSMVPLIGAVSAGCCAFVKPSELAPASANIIKQVIDEAFNGQSYMCGLGGADFAGKLLAERWDHIFFTGSIPVGKIVAAAAAKHLTPTVLELGGKSPAIVHKDANIKLSAKRIAWGKIVNAGQTCIAPDYLYVHRDIYKAFIEKLIRSLKEMLGEKPLVNNDYPNIINRKHYDRLKSYMENAEIIHGGETDDRLCRIAPTLIEAPDKNSAIMLDEIFGPLLPIYSYEDIFEPVEFIQSREKPLSLYLFTESTSMQDELITNIQFGGGCVNDTLLHAGNTNLPFGGVGTSGMGSYHGEFSFTAFTHYKGIVNRSTWLEFPFRFQPYKEKWLKIIKKIL